MAVPIVATAVTSAYSAVPQRYKQQALAWAKKASGDAVTNVKQMAAFAATSPAAAVTVAEGLVRHGAPVEATEAIFSNLTNAAQIRANLVNLGRSLITQEDATRPGLNASVPDTANDKLRKELCSSLVRAFGSVKSARKVQMALATLREADFDWYESIITR